MRAGLLAALVVGLTACTGSTSSGPTPEAATTMSTCPPYSPAPALARDRVLGVEVQHVESAVVIELHQRNIVASNAQAWDFAVETPTGTWTVEAFRDGARTDAMLGIEPVLPTPDPGSSGCVLYTTTSGGVDCRGLSAVVSPWDDNVQVVIPRRCLDAPAWVRVGATVWDGEHGETHSSPELGPRVRVH
jgi:hypothetical protein